MDGCWCKSLRECALAAVDDWDGRRIMDTAYISAISALAGSVIGGLTTGFTTWLSQRSQARAGMIAHDLSRREDLVRDFIVAASKTYGDAVVSNEPKLPEIVDLYAMVSRLRVLSMPRSVACADIVMRTIVDTPFSRRITRSAICATSSRKARASTP